MQIKSEEMEKCNSHDHDSVYITEGLRIKILLRAVRCFAPLLLYPYTGIGRINQDKL